MYPSGGSRTTHAPAMHTCAALHVCIGPHALPSSIAARPQPLCGSHTPFMHAPSPGHGGAGRCSQPLVSLHTSTVQAFSSSHDFGVPTHRPAWQVPPLTH